MKILVFNCGSSSIKYQLFEMPQGEVLAKGIVERIGEEQGEATQKAGGEEIVLETTIPDHKAGLAIIGKMITDEDKGPLDSISEIQACGHRVVHGGEAFTDSMVIDDELEKVIEEYFDLAPLHNPPNLAGIQEAKKLMGGKIPQIACFDTSFHQTIPETAFLYGLPYEMYSKLKVRRYGFHGTSHRYVADRASELLGEKEGADLITCHLGNGCSITAVKKGKSVDTSMGLTPLEGVVMGTRTGDMDPAIIFFLKRKGYSIEEIDKICNKQSGLLGISGISNDVRDLEEKAAAGEKQAQLALDIFAYRIRKYIGTYLAVLNGADAVVFTGGIGENASIMRKRIISGLENLGIILDTKKNKEMIGEEGTISTDDTSIKVMVIPTDEEKIIASDTYNLVQ